jgi:hypothetical protein
MSKAPGPPVQLLNAHVVAIMEEKPSQLDLVVVVDD